MKLLLLINTIVQIAFYIGMINPKPLSPKQNNVKKIFCSEPKIQSVIY